MLKICNYISTTKVQDQVKVNIKLSSVFVLIVCIMISDSAAIGCYLILFNGKMFVLL